MQLEIQARFGDLDDDSYVSISTLTPDSQWPSEFVLARKWVTVKFQEEGATLHVDGEALQVAPDGEWHAGELIGVQVRVRLRQDLDGYREWPTQSEAPKY